MRIRRCVLQVFCAQTFRGVDTTIPQCGSAWLHIVDPTAYISDGLYAAGVTNRDDHSHVEQWKQECYGDEVSDLPRLE